jgi:hypothetical protein
MTIFAFCSGIEERTMLRDRVQMNKQGFMVKKTDDERTLAYGTYSAKEPPDYMPKMGQAGYWEPVYQTIIDLGGKGCFVYLEESIEECVVETARFYWQPGEKQMLSIYTEPNDKYGKNAFVITVEWTDGHAEPFNGEYIYLTDNNGDKYYFLKERIAPLDTEDDPPIDQYVYIVPEGDDPARYKVEVTDLLREKYQVEISGK